MRNAAAAASLSSPGSSKAEQVRSRREARRARNTLMDAAVVHLHAMRKAKAKDNGSRSANSGGHTRRARVPKASPTHSHERRARNCFITRATLLEPYETPTVPSRAEQITRYKDICQDSLKLELRVGIQQNTSCRLEQHRLCSSLSLPRNCIQPTALSRGDLSRLYPYLS